MSHTKFTVLVAALMCAHLALTQTPRAAGQSQAPATPKQPAHSTVTAETKDSACVGCHKEVLAREVLHGPVAAESCTDCHVAPPAGQGAMMTLAKGATKDNTAPLCINCHEDVGERLKEAHVHGPVASGDCISCHDAHGSAFPLFLPAAKTDTCLLCHDTIGTALKEKARHAPAAANCGTCHDPHASPNPGQLRAAGNVLCQGCHQGKPADVTPGKAPSLFGRELPEAEQRFLLEAPRIALDAMGRRGHPNVDHPVAGVPDPNDTKRMLSCVSCHQPHGAAERPLLQFGLKSTLELCLRCHK